MFRLQVNARPNRDGLGAASRGLSTIYFRGLKCKCDLTVLTSKNYRKTRSPPSPHENYS